MQRSLSEISPSFTRTRSRRSDAASAARRALAIAARSTRSSADQKIGKSLCERRHLWVREIRLPPPAAPEDAAIAGFQMTCALSGGFRVRIRAILGDFD